MDIITVSGLTKEQALDNIGVIVNDPNFKKYELRFEVKGRFINGEFGVDGRDINPQERLDLFNLLSGYIRGTNIYFKEFAFGLYAPLDVLKELELPRTLPRRGEREPILHLGLEGAAKLEPKKKEDYTKKKEDYRFPAKSSPEDRYTFSVGTYCEESSMSDSANPLHVRDRECDFPQVREIWVPKLLTVFQKVIPHTDK